MGVPGGAGGQQRTTQPRRGHGEGVDALVQIPVGRGAADAVVAGQLRQPGAVEKPAQHQHRLPVAAQRPAPTAGAAAPSFGGQRARHELHGLLGDRKDGGVGDRIGHSRTSGGKTVCEKTSLLPRSCASSRHLALVGVSAPTCQPPATGKGSVGAHLRVACFAVEPLAPLATLGGAAAEAETLVTERWVDYLKPIIAATLERTTSYPSADPIDITVGRGSSWADALTDIDWTNDEILVIGTSSSPIGRLFLGSHAAKIVRNSPVPVMLVPRSVLNRPSEAEVIGRPMAPRS